MTKIWVVFKTSPDFVCDPKWSKIHVNKIYDLRCLIQEMCNAINSKITANIAIVLLKI